MSSEDFEREERAFAEALHASVPVETFRPLDADAIKAAAGPARPGRRWLRTMAAAAVLVVAVGVGAALLPRVGASHSMTAVPASGYGAGGAVPETAEDRGSAAAQPSASGSSLPDGWTSTTPSPLSPRVYASGGWLGGKFYIVGGRGLKADCSPKLTFCAQDSNNLTDGASYDPVTDSWERLPDSPQPVGTAAPVVVGGRLYYSDSQSGSPVAPLFFDTVARTWQKLPAPAQAGQLVAAGDRLVSVGTADGGISIDQVLDPVTGTWSALPTGEFAKSEWRRGVYAHGQLIVGGTGFFSGGDPYAKFEVLDLATNTWHKLAQPKIAGVGGVRVGDYVVIGVYQPAERDGKKYAAGARYNLLTGEWSDLPAPSRTVRVFPDAYGQVVGNRMMIKSQLFDPADGSWTPLTSPNPKVLNGMTVVGSPGGLLVFGGVDHDTLTDRTYYLPVP